MRGAHLLRSLAVLFLLASSCTTPELDGFQLECNWNSQQDNEQICPDGQVCRASCCVSGDTEPTCHLLQGFGESGATAAGVSCTGGCADYSCKGTCPGDSAMSCLDQQSTGFPGGICTQPCNNCDGVCAQLPGMGQGTCVSHCSTNDECRAGYRCSCNLPNQPGDCGCVPDCANSPGACGEGRKVDGSRCDSSTGRCYACLPSSQSCSEGSDCCSGNCCAGLCQDGACQ
jgi:hypothetical protein